MRDHARRAGHDDRKLMAGTILNAEIAPNYIIVEVKKNLCYSLINQNIIPEEEKNLNKVGGATNDNSKNNLKILGWNCRFLAKAENKTLIKYYLQNDAPDFLMINECGKVNANLLKK